MDSISKCSSTKIHKTLEPITNGSLFTKMCENILHLKTENTGLTVLLEMGKFICGKCGHRLGEIISHSTEGTTIKINRHFTYNSIEVIYLIKCPCGLLCWEQIQMHIHLNE